MSTNDFYQFFYFQNLPYCKSRFTVGQIQPKCRFFAFFYVLSSKNEKYHGYSSKMIVFASSIGFTTLWNVVERYSSKKRFKKVQIPKTPPGHKEGTSFEGWIGEPQ